MTGAFRIFLVFSLGLYGDKIPDMHNYVHLILFHIWKLIIIWVGINPLQKLHQYSNNSNPAKKQIYILYKTLQKIIQLCTGMFPFKF